MPTRLILIRHAKTKWNLEKRYSGAIDIGLSRIGIKQANGLRRRIREGGIYKIYSSDKKRAMQTARIVFRGKRIKEVPDLAEMGFGIFEGSTYKELMEKYPLIYKKWLADPQCINIPGGENFKDFKRRIVRAFRKIISENKNRTIAVVSHGGAISIFINSILKSGEFFRYIPESASITIIEHKNGKPKIKLFNGVSHLNENG